MWMLRVAMAHRKILLIDWNNPAPLTNFFTPNDIDWTFNGLNASMFHEPNSISSDVYFPAVYEGTPGLLEQFRDTKSFVTTTNAEFEQNMMKTVPQLNLSQSTEIGSCYFTFLFKVNQTIVERGEAHLRQLYGPTPVEYVAWHWRHGDADLGNQTRPVQDSHIMQVQKALETAQRMGASVGINTTQTPVMLITDFNALRYYIMQGRLASFVTPNITARYIDTRTFSQDTYTNVFVDIYLLSRARCLLVSHSGFSRLALWLGGAGGAGPLVSCYGGSGI